MSFALGAKPQALTVYLNRDADFVSGLKNKIGDWPSDASIELRFPQGEVVWPAAVTDDLAMWNVDKADVNELIAGQPYSVALFIVEGDADLIWATGKVVVG